MKVFGGIVVALVIPNVTVYPNFQRRLFIQAWKGLGSLSFLARKPTGTSRLGFDGDAIFGRCALQQFSLLDSAEVQWLF